jgi:hypothetical protein
MSTCRPFVYPAAVPVLASAAYTDTIDVDDGASLDGDGFVGISDFLDLLWHFGPCTK